MEKLPEFDAAVLARSGRLTLTKEPVTAAAARHAPSSRAAKPPLALLPFAAVCRRSRTALAPGLRTARMMLRSRDLRQLRQRPAQLLRAVLVEFVWHRQRPSGSAVRASLWWQVFTLNRKYTCTQLRRSKHSGCSDRARDPGFGGDCAGSFFTADPRWMSFPATAPPANGGLNLVNDLREYRAGRLAWECIEKGLLLVGPPGVGKTQFARAVAKSANVPLVSTSVADWNASPYLSGTLAAIKESFSRARQLAPCILFIDELDGISDRATLTSDYKEYWTQIVNLLLELLAGIEDRPGVVVIGASNHPEHIDAAVKRAGRLDRTIEIDLPDSETLAAIFRFHVGHDVLLGVDLLPVALAAAGRTGADVEAWVRRAKSRARRAERHLALDDLLQEVRCGREAMPKSLRRTCAVHEAGHVVAGIALGVFEPRALTILDHGGATRVELSRANSQTLTGIENYITTLLSGRSAEEIILGASRTTAGSGIGENSDFARATEAATDLELRFGFGALGVAHFPDRATEMLLHDASVVGLIKQRLDRCLARARELITENRTAVEAVAQRLDETGYLDCAAIDDLLKTHPVRAIAGRDQRELESST